MNSLNRRKFIKTSMIATAVGTICSSLPALAAWPVQAYTEKSVDAVLANLFGDQTTKVTKKIVIKTPQIAENGAVVPVSIKTSLPQVESISLLVKNNPNPLVARFTLQATNKGEISTRIKIGKSSDVIAVVQSQGQLYTAQNFVKVTIGGCGG